ncbi:4-hydroxy-2-oxovalerate aldolase [Sulfurospirillum sp.]|uniref:4-hydroxy-2-oxovalerate aldolase n=1 Tax=Sulfurospirillum sp. TaxID=2053622 RepID=UPI002FDD6364
MIHKINLYDVTLRDGSHAISHQLSISQVDEYTKAIDTTGVYAIEVGHGNGLGASSVLVGQSQLSDEILIKTAKNNLQHTKLGIHVIPGFATIKKDIEKALSWGVDIVRVASHCTEADITERHLGYVREKGKEAYGLLMMSHMASPEILLDEAIKMQTYGAEAIVILDSAGSYLPDDVKARITLLSQNLNVPVGFHAHNNLGLGISNSLVAIEAGAQIIDGATKGFGAGAGNAQMEVLAAVLQKMNYKTNVDLYRLLDVADLVEKDLIKEPITISSLSIVSAIAGVFSGFSKHVKRIAKEFNVDPRDIFMELGKQKVVAGQEDTIIDIALKLQKRI